MRLVMNLDKTMHEQSVFVDGVELNMRMMPMKDEI